MGLLVLLLSIGFRYLLNIYLSDVSIEITAFVVGFNCLIVKLGIKGIAEFIL